MRYVTVVTLAAAAHLATACEQGNSERTPPASGAASSNSLVDSAARAQAGDGDADSASAVPRRQGATPELDSYALQSTPAAQWDLPIALSEISGLTVSADDRLFGHADESAMIHEIDYRRGRIAKSFALGQETVRGDFEGIAIAEGRFYLATSGGTILESEEGGNGERVAYKTHDSGLGGRCEVEGLTFDPPTRSLLLACKRGKGSELEGSVAIFRWSLETRSLAPRPLIMPGMQFTRGTGWKGFHPSGIDRHPRSGTYIIVAATEEALAEVTPEGELLAVKRLPKSVGPQPEAIAFTSDRTLIIGAEGKGKRATLTVFRAGGGQ